MTKLDKLIKKILDGDTIITLIEAQKLLSFLGYVGESPGTSHITYRKEGVQKITLVLNKKELKDYQIKRLQEALKQAGY